MIILIPQLCWEEQSIPKIWDMLGKAELPSNDPLLSADAIHRWTERVLSYYDAMPDDWPPEIIKLEGVMDFIERLPVEMRKMLKYSNREER